MSEEDVAVPLRFVTQQASSARSEKRPGVTRDKKKPKFLASLCITVLKWCPCARRRLERAQGDYAIIRPPEFTDALNESPDEKSQALRALRNGLQAFDNGQFEKAKRFYEEASAKGDITAVHNLGTMYLFGQGIQRDAQKALECFLFCARNGVAPSMGQLGYMYMYGKGVKQDYGVAKRWFLRASDVGNDAYSQFQLGSMYLEGINTPVNTRKGFYWLCKSVEGNYLPAIYNLGVLFMTGVPDFPQDLNAAVSLFEHAAEFGDDPYAQNNLGILYARGEGGLPQSYLKGATYFTMAAKKEITEAQFNLGECYANGLGVERDLTIAAEYYYLATKTGDNNSAEFRLAQLFLQSEATFKQDLSMALYWFGRSAQHKNKLALANYHALKTLLDSTQDYTPEFQKSTNV